MSYQLQTPQKLLEAAARGLDCPPAMSLSQWADEHVWLSPEDSAEEGKFHTARAEYQRGMMDAISDPAISDVVLKCSAQVGKTRILLNAIGYYIDHDPCPLMLVQPTLEMAEAFSKERLAPMLRDTPQLAGKVGEARSRDSGNTLRSKKFPGGDLAMVGANSPASLSSRPRRVVLFDEVSRYDRSAGTEGDPVNLGKKRTNNFWNAKRVYVSSPGIEGLCRITDLWELSDKRRFFVDCPYCKETQYLEFDTHLKYVEGPGRMADSGEMLRQAVDAWMECSQCMRRWSEAERQAAVSAGVWVDTAPFTGIAGFHIWEGLSPWSTPLKIANAWLEAQGKPEQIKTFRNTVQGETYKQEGNFLDWERLTGRRGEFDPFTAPNGVLFVTAGVDVQSDRIVADYWGWGRERRRWFLGRSVLLGDTTRLEVWKDLTDDLARVFPHETGHELRVARVAIDSGHASTQVYDWAKSNRQSGQVIVVKGQASGDALIGQPVATDINRAGKHIKAGVRVWPVNVSMCKQEIYGCLGQDKPGPNDPIPAGWVSFHHETEDAWFRELTVERFVIHIVKGFRKGDWVKPPGARNEALDCANYARAAASQFAEHKYREFEALLSRPIVREAAPVALVAAQQSAKSGWFSGANSRQQGGWFSR
jgi:phage terminase large subunit GpA-like protein